MGLEDKIRKIARSSYWQTLYNNSKNCNGITLFNNNNDFSGIQVIFLYWLSVYSMLYDEHFQLEYENLDLKVIEDNDRCDAFLFWRRKEQEKKLRKYKTEERKNNKTSKSGSSFKIFKGPLNKKEGE